VVVVGAARYVRIRALGLAHVTRSFPKSGPAFG
jgi:hypothetical protein